MICVTVRSADPADLPRIAAIYDEQVATAVSTFDVTAPPLTPRGGVLQVGRVTPDPALLAAHEASVDRRDWWLERLTRCHALLA